ncbi:WecB/TagA/CpsF family glycosyltransferase [Candidatus Saccharibacteria bacterium]|nr:WecB/TagA/CpsF family glycosyltransferase [Candidatus Saccharibacteria bacterium]
MIKVSPKKTRVNILGVGVDSLTIVEANNSIAQLIARPAQKSYYIVKPYVEFFISSMKDPKIQSILNDADLILADGISVQWAASYLYGNPHQAFLKTWRSLLFWLQKPHWKNQILPEKMAGANQTYPLLKLAENNGWRVGIIGGNNQPESIKLAIQKIFPKLKYIEVWNGYFLPSDEKNITTQIAHAKLDILFVAMGFTRQELFIDRNLNNNLATVMIGEGGTFDYNEFGGSIKRAPVGVQKIGLEWLWRLFRQPKRIKRQLSIPKFIFSIRRQAKKR